MQETQVVNVNGDNGADDDLTVLQFLEIIRRRWLVMLIITLIVTAVGIANYMRKSPIYESTAKLLVNTEDSAKSISSTTGLLSDVVALTQGRDIGTQLELMKSNDTLDKAFAKLSPVERENGFRSDKVPEWATSIDKGDQYSSVITVKVKSYDPVIARRFAELIVDTYLERGTEINSKATRQAIDKVGHEMRNVSEQLERASDRLAEYQAREQLAGKDEQAVQIVNSLIDLQQQYKTGRVDLASVEAQIKVKENQLTSLDPKIIASETIARNPDFDKLANELRELNIEKATKSVDYKPGSREMTKIDASIDAIRKELNNLSERLVQSNTEVPNPQRDSIFTEYSTLVAEQAAQKARLSALESVIADFQNQIDQMPGKMKDMASLTRMVSNLENTYNQLSTEYYSLMVREQSTIPNGVLFESPKIPDFPSEPNLPKTLLVYMAMGLIFGLLIGTVIDKLDTKIHSIKIGEDETGLVTMGAVPLLPISPSSMREILAEDNGMRGFWESIKIMRNNILYSEASDKSVIAVTSPGPSAGKSLVSSCLAHVLALDGKNVCLIDCDLRKPNLHKIWGIPREVGFTNVIRGAASLDDVLIKPEGSNISILPAGHLPPNPSEFLNSPQTLQLINYLREKFDYVIVDTPPTAGFSDVQVVSRWVDSILLVIALNQTTKPEVQAALRNIRQAGNNLIGAVYNKINERHGDYYYYYYYYSNYDENGTEQKTKKRKRKRKTE